MKHCHPKQVALEHHKAANDNYLERPSSEVNTHRRTFYYNYNRHTGENLIVGQRDLEAAEPVPI
jgi:hypothetical protein